MTIKSKLREQVKWQLSQDELLDYGSKIATYEKDLTQLETAKKEIPRQMASVRAKMSSVREAILAGWEWRGVDCFERLRGATVEVVRSDTLEVIGSRKAEQSDVQTTIEDVAPELVPNRVDAVEGLRFRLGSRTGTVTAATPTSPSIAVCWDGDPDAEELIPRGDWLTLDVQEIERPKKRQRKAKAAAAE